MVFLFRFRLIILFFIKAHQPHRVNTKYFSHKGNTASWNIINDTFFIFTNCRLLNTKAVAQFFLRHVYMKAALFDSLSH